MGNRTHANKTGVESGTRTHGFTDLQSGTLATLSPLHKTWRRVRDSNPRYRVFAPYVFLAGRWFQPAHPTLQFGGNGEIRTHGPFLIDSFQDCCNKPDSATFPKLWYSVGESNPSSRRERAVS